MFIMSSSYPQSQLCHMLSNLAVIRTGFNCRFPPLMGYSLVSVLLGFGSVLQSMHIRAHGAFSADL